MESAENFRSTEKKMIFEILCILSVIIGQMVNIGTGIHRIEVKFVRLRERLTRPEHHAFAAHFPSSVLKACPGTESFCRIYRS